MRLIRVLAVMCVVAACGPSHKRTPDGGGDDDANGGCTEGQHSCSGADYQTCQGGQFVTTETCAMACSPELGCVVCVPGTGTCNGDTSHACLPDGTGYFDEFCDPVMGSTCDTNQGICVGACSSHTLGQSYIGCDYYATVTSQLVQPSFQFAVAISNTTTSAATVTIDGGALTSPITLTVQPSAVATQKLPWVPALKTCNTEGFLECGPPEQYGALAAKGGYHVRSTQPVTLYQFSPLDYTDGNGDFSYSNDASLLLPTNAWSKDFVVASWQAWNPGFAGIMPGVLAVTAATDGTAVTVKTRAATTGGQGAPSFVAGTPQTVMLNRGDVLQLMTSSGDLTGSFVNADKPIEVIGAHHCTQVPIGYTACDHMEESMIGIDALADEYIVTAPLLGSAPREEMIRIVATTAATTVTLDPPVAGPYTLANPGDFVEIAQNDKSFKVTADHKILVAQYMESQDAPSGNGTGDPAMTLAVPTAQYRKDYQFHAPTNYTTNIVNVTAPTGADVVIDGTSIPATSYTPIGTSGYSVASVTLANTGTGTHLATSSMAFGIAVYGYGSYTSYWYPGGLDLQTIVIQ
jgi:hypothetical protein